MATTPGTPSTPAPGRIKTGRIIIMLIVGSIFLLWAACPTKPPDTARSKAATKPPSEYNPTRICPLVFQAADGKINNPLGIKFFGDFLKKVAKDSHIPAKDGGTFATFATPEKGIDAGKQMLRSKDGIYAEKNVEWAMRKWSNGAYGAEIAKGTIKPDAEVGTLSDADMDVLIAAMTKREGVSPAATAMPYENPNDHRGETSSEFFVEAPHGCFLNNESMVMMPRHWGSWAEEIVSDDSDAQVAIWFLGRGGPIGPFTNATLPNGYHANTWRLQGVGKSPPAKIRVRYTLVEKR